MHWFYVKMYMTLELALHVVLVVENDALVSDWDEDLFSLPVGKVVNPVVDVVVEAERPFKFERRCLA